MNIYSFLADYKRGNYTIWQYIQYEPSLSLIINIYCARIVRIRHMFVWIYYKHYYNNLYKTIYLCKFQRMLPLVTRRMYKLYFSSWLVFFNRFSVTVYTIQYILASSFPTSAIGVAKILSLMYPQKKKSKGVVSGECGGQGFD